MGPFERQVMFLLTESARGGQAAGKLEVDLIRLETAQAYAKVVFESYGRDFTSELPRFDQNFLLAKSKTKIGRTRRRDMPVITDDQVRQFQDRLKSGMLDINKPLAPGTPVDNPFPEGLSGEQAKQFVQRGLKDGSIPDDIIKVSMGSVAAKDLNPIQRQIYFDKSIEGLAKFGVDGSKSFMSKTLTVMSSDNYIIDGHHRWLSCLLIDPSFKMKGVKIDLPIAKLLPLSRAYGDAIGNKRNESYMYDNYLRESVIGLKSKVQYRAKFLKSIGMRPTDSIWRAKGIVTDIKQVGQTKIATVKWLGDEDLPEKINVKNLTLVGVPELD